MSQVYDSVGNRFPDPCKDDAYYTMTVAEDYFNRVLKDKNQTALGNERSHRIGVEAAFMAMLYKKTTDNSLKQAIQPKLEMRLKEMMDRQFLSSYYFPSWILAYPSPLGIIADLKGYVKTYNKSIWDPENRGEYIENPFLDPGDAGMAFFEGYDALKDGKNVLSFTYIPDADVLKERGELATNKTIRAGESRGGFTSDGTDYYGGVLFHSLFYADEADEEEANRGGDFLLSTANNYGTALDAISQAYLTTGSNYYSDRIAWASDEVERLQKKQSGINKGGIRDGPLLPLDPISEELKWSRLTEQIWYAGMTSFGLRQAYDATSNSDAFTVITELANHYQNTREEWGLWPNMWNFEAQKPVNVYNRRNEGGRRTQVRDDAVWGALIQLDGNKITTGFRQAAVDIGDYSNVTTHAFSYTLYQALKMDSNSIIFARNHPPLEAPTAEGVIYVGLSKTRKVLLDSTVSTAMFKAEWSGSDLDVNLKTPEGTIITGSVNMSEGNITYVENTTTEYYQVVAPASGHWTMNTTGIDLPPEGELFFTNIVLDTTLNSQTYTDREEYVQGETVSISTVVKNGSVGVTGATVVANVTKPDGSSTLITLLDQSDGIYNSTFTDASQAGAYSIYVNVSGTIGGNAFFREGDNIFQVKDVTPPTINIIGPANNSNVSSSVSLTWAGGDNSGQVTYYVYVDWQPYESTTNTWMWVNNLNSSTHSLQVLAVDGSLNYVVDSITVTVSGLEAYIFASMFDLEKNPGDQLYSLIYVENTGGSNIDDHLMIKIGDPAGKTVYKKTKPIYLESGEAQFVRLYWDIPEDAAKGLYKLRVEFDDGDIDYLPGVRSFKVE